MQNVTKYTIFKTKWGYFGLAGTENGLLRTCLPLGKPENVKSRLLESLLLLNQASSIKHQASNTESLRAKRSNLAHLQIRDCHGLLRRPRNDTRASSIESRASRIEFDKIFFKTVQEQIIAYFEGDCVNFSTEFSHQDTKSQRNQIYKEKTSSLGVFVAKNTDIPIVLEGLSDFCSSVLTVCRDIKFGQTVSYLELAKKLGRPKAARAVGNALVKNPLPLIIPCHRVVRSDGRLGGFSASGGTKLKEKLLRHERGTPFCNKSQNGNPTGTNATEKRLT